MSRGLLSMFAGGDPWKVNTTLQSGRPAQIGELAQAFHNAGQSTREADQAFSDARKVPQPLPHDSQLFEGYQPVEPGPEFTKPDGSLNYPDDSLPGHVYAMPGTVSEAHLPAGTVIDRFGYPGGG
jgi:hypothetical protein